ASVLDLVDHHRLDVVADRLALARVELAHGHAEADREAVRIGGVAVVVVAGHAAAALAAAARRLGELDGAVGGADLGLAALAFAQEVDRDVLADRRIGDLEAEAGDVVDARAVERGDDVPAADARARRRRVVGDVLHDDAGVGADAVRLGEVGRELRRL